MELEETRKKDEVNNKRIKIYETFYLERAFSLMNREEIKPSSAIITENQRVTWIASW